MKPTYNFKKGVANIGYIFIGVIVVRLQTQSNIAQCLIDMNCDISPILMTKTFWGHVLFSASVISLFAELKYLLNFLSSYGSNVNGQKSN